MGQQVFVSSVLLGCSIFIITFVGIREKIVDAIPMELRIAVSVGIGLFIAFIGMKNLGLVEADPATLVRMGKYHIACILGIRGLQ